MHRPLVLLLPLLLAVSACDSGGSGDPSAELLVEDLVVGSGDVLADGEAVMIAFTGSLEDGTVFEVSDNQNPFAFSVGAGQVIRGLDEGLVGMRVGGTRRLTIPPHLAFGKSGVCDDSTCPVPGNSTVVFEVTLIRILDQPFVRDDVIGDGAEVVDGAYVVFHYTAALSDGTIVGTTTIYNSPIQTTIGDGALIPGLEMGLLGMRQGGSRTIIIPPDLAYGADGDGRSIPPHAVLRLTIDLLIVDADG